MTVRLELVRVELAEANAFVSAYHRHHGKVVGHIFSLGAALTRCRIAGGLAEPLFAVTIKNVLMPVIVWSLAVHVFELPPLWSRAAILLAAMPTGVNVYLFAARYAAARELATTTVFLSTTFSLLSVSVVLYLLQTLG